MNIFSYTHLAYAFDFQQLIPIFGITLRIGLGKFASHHVKDQLILRNILYLSRLDHLPVTHCLLYTSRCV